MKALRARLNASALLLLAAALLSGCGERPHEYTGSASCKECHEKFYKLWEPSHHGKALQPWSADLAAHLPQQPEPIEAEGRSYQTVITPERGFMRDDQGKEYDIAYSIGGKNYYNFLTLLDDGRLQVLPVYYNVREQMWGNTTHSMLRHFEDGSTDTPVSWRDPLLTFNAACFSCHVSQLESNYDPETDTYATTWNEAGISCESCHGPASEHLRVCKGNPTNHPPKDLEIISWKHMSVQQKNDNCSGCHTKGAPITSQFETNDRYWDHYDLVTFEHPDYYADGRDLGENYTMGSWWLSPCVTKGNLTCTHCHTSSGRFKQKDNPNSSCLPCHQQRVENAAEHMHHPNGGATNCVACHMPMNPFGGMNQSDHSMRPPMPQLSKAVGSRNACIMCHKDKDNDWALEQINQWHPDFEQHRAFELDRALLVKALRDGDWDKLPAALDYIQNPDSEPLFVTSLIRLLPPANNPAQKRILRQLATGADHPLVRSAAVTALDADNDFSDRPALFKALYDDYRLVRVRAAERLAALPDNAIPDESRQAYDAALNEMWNAYNLRLDNWSSHFNTGNILMRQQRYAEAAAKYDRAHELRDDIAPPLINGAMALANLRDLDDAEIRLKKATQLPEPAPAAHYNLGLLYAEQGRTAEAEQQLYRCIELQPENAQAAANLAILVAEKNIEETYRLLQQAIDADPYNPRYVQNLAYYYLQNNHPDLAKDILKDAFTRGLRTAELRGMYQQLQAD